MMIYFTPKFKVLSQEEKLSKSRNYMLSKEKEKYKLNKKLLKVEMKKVLSVKASRNNLIMKKTKWLMRQMKIISLKISMLKMRMMLNLILKFNPPKIWIFLMLMMMMIFQISLPRFQIWLIMVNQRRKGKKEKFRNLSSFQIKDQGKIIKKLMKPPNLSAKRKKKEKESNI